MLQRNMIILFTTTLLLFNVTLSCTVAEAANAEIEIEGNVVNVIDGDTLDIMVYNGSQYRIRLADIDAPERDEKGYVEAKDYLRMLVYGETVCLDIDDLYTWDEHGSGERLVAVLYINYNSTHYLNINEALFKAGFAEKKDYANEFNPYSWSLYTLKQENHYSPLISSTAAVIVVLAVLVFLYLKSFRRRRRV